MSVTVTDRSKEWEAILHGRIRAGVMRAGLDIQRAAIMRAPHKTGALWNSIRAESTASSPNIVEVTVSANTPYARRWEFEPAHFTVGGNRYMRGAAEMIAPRFMSGSYFT